MYESKGPVSFGKKGLKIDWRFKHSSIIIALIIFIFIAIVFSTLGLGVIYEILCNLGIIKFLPNGIHKFLKSNYDFLINLGIGIKITLMVIFIIIVVAIAIWFYLHDFKRGFTTKTRKTIFLVVCLAFVGILFIIPRVDDIKNNVSSDIEQIKKESKKAKQAKEKQKRSDEWDKQHSDVKILTKRIINEYDNHSYVGVVDDAVNLLKNTTIDKIDSDIVNKIYKSIKYLSTRNLNLLDRYLFCLEGLNGYDDSQKLYDELKDISVKYYEAENIYEKYLTGNCDDASKLTNEEKETVYNNIIYIYNINPNYGYSYDVINMFKSLQGYRDINNYLVKLKK